MNEFTGEEWQVLLKDFNVKQLRGSLKRAYRTCGKKARAIAVTKLRETGMSVQGNRSDWEKGVRVYNFSKGGGFMITVKGVGGKSMHENRFYRRTGRKLPVLMFAEDGTKKRVRRHHIVSTSRRSGRVHSGSTGSMPGYHFLEKATPQMFRVVESDMGKAVEESVVKTAKKL